MFKLLNIFKFSASSKAIVFVCFFIAVTIAVAQAKEQVQVLSDPTRPANMMMGQSIGTAKEKSSNSYKVSQIYIGKINKGAIINGQKVQQGDRIDGSEVLSIKSDRVQLRINGRLTEITIMPSIKKYME